MENAIRMHGDRGRYLVNVGEKCNLMIPWTKVQKKFHCSYGSNHTQAIVLQLVSISNDGGLLNEH